MPTDGASPGSVLDPATLVARRVGPRQPPAAAGAKSVGLAADSHFAATLITLWHKVSEAGGAVGFEPGAARTELGSAVTEAVNGLRAGTRHAVALTAGNTLVAVGFLVPKPSRIQRHLAEVQTLMVDPEFQGRGIGRRLIVELSTLASELGVSTLLLGARDGQGLDTFYESLGFVEYGRLPDAIRLADGSRLAEIRYRRELAG